MTEFEYEMLKIEERRNELMESELKHKNEEIRLKKIELEILITKETYAVGYMTPTQCAERLRKMMDRLSN